MPQVVTATQARQDFAEIINRVMYRGEEFIVEKQGKPAAFIISPKGGKIITKMTGVNFLRKLTTYKLKGAPRDLAKNHDKYTWE